MTDRYKIGDIVTTKQDCCSTHRYEVIAIKKKNKYHLKSCETGLVLRYVPSTQVSLSDQELEPLSWWEAISD